MEIHAVRPIAKGEEITVTYATLSAKAADRQNSLKPYGFTCVCPACTDAEASDEERKRVLTSLLPKTSQGVEHAESALIAYEATGLQSHPRYRELLRRVANIHRKKGDNGRADALETLAERVAGRNSKEGMWLKSTTTPVEARVFTSPQDMMKFIMERVDPNESMRMLQELTRTMGV